MKTCFSLLVLALSFSVSASVSTHSTDTKKVEIKKAEAFNFDCGNVTDYTFSFAILAETVEVKIYGNVVKPADRVIVTDFVPTKFQYPLARSML